jgi:hypothetical protein
MAHMTAPTIGEDTFVGVLTRLRNSSSSGELVTEGLEVELFTFDRLDGTAMRVASLREVIATVAEELSLRR